MIEVKLPSHKLLTHSVSTGFNNWLSDIAKMINLLILLYWKIIHI